MRNWDFLAPAVGDATNVNIVDIREYPLFRNDINYKLTGKTLFHKIQYKVDSAAPPFFLVLDIQ